MNCLRNHGPRMKFRLGHAKVNNPPRSEAVSRGTTQRRRRRRRRRGNGSRAIPTSFLPVLEAVGRLACRRISACLLRGWRGKWSSSVRYGLVIPPRSLSLSSPLHFILFAIPFSPLFSPALASSSCPSLPFHLYIYIYKSLLLYFLISEAWRREETIFGGGGEATQQKGNQLRSFSFQGTKACLEALPDDSTKRRFLLCRKLPRGVFLNSAASIFF